MCTVVYLAEILRQMAIELSPTILIVVAEGITCMRIRNVGSQYDCQTKGYLLVVLCTLTAQRWLIKCDLDRVYPRSRRDCKTKHI